MTPERWRQIEELFHEADERAPEERPSFLAAACDGDFELRSQVENLLRSAGEDQQSIEGYVGAAAQEVLGEELLRSRQKIGAYEVIRLLGEGGMGVVYLARRADAAYQQNVAIKIIRPSFALHNIVERFRSERQILANLIHPNIARLLDGGVMPSGQPYLVMEYLDGAAIDVWTKEHRSTLRERLQMFRAVCAGVQYAHQNLVVHRDIKPANILVCSDGTPKLLDFGLARVLDVQNTGSPAAARWTERLMTPEYASPEQLMGQPITTATDVYALGVLLYELLTGERPFNLGSASPIELQKVITGEIPRPSVVCRETRRDRRTADMLRGDLDNIVLKALHKEPARRYASAGELSEDLEHYLNGFPVRAQPDSWSYRSSKFIGRHRWGVGAAALFVMVLLGFGAGMAVLAQKARLQRDRAETISSFLVGLFRAADPDGVSSREVTVRQMLDRGVGSVDELRAEPSVQSKLLDTFGRVYDSLGAERQSRELMQRSIAIKRSVYGADSLEMAESLKDLADVDRTLKLYAEAEPLARHSLQIRSKRLGQRNSLVAETRNTLGIILQETGRLREAEKLFLEVLAVRDILAEREHLDTAVLSNLGVVYRDLGDLPKAEQYLSECVAIRRKELHGDHPRLALALAKLGQVQEDLGKLAEAEASLAEGLAIRERLFGPHHVYVARSLLTLAPVHRKRGRYQQATADLDRVSEIYRLNGAESDSWSVLHFQEALLWEAQSKLAKAEEALKECLSERRPSLGDGNLNVAKTELALAELLVKERRLPEARQAAQAAMLVSGTMPAAQAVRRDAQAVLKECGIE